MTPCVAGVATAVPPHVVEQSTVREFARAFFADDFPEIDRLLGAFTNTGIERRHLARATEWYSEPHDFPEKNRIYREVALDLAEQASNKAIEASGISREDIAGIVLVSSTGVATPSLDARLVQTLGLRRDIARTPIWGLGCAGGSAGLARAASLVRGTGRPVLMIAVELCSTTFMHGDRSKSNLIATALFGDGAAAVVLAPEGKGPQLLAGHSHLLDDSEDIMGWEVEPTGLRVIFSRSIPSVVHQVAPGVVRDAAQAAGLAADELAHFVFHPGGSKVLAAYAEALSIDPERLCDARLVLRDYGNMSSPTALFVLERFMGRVAPTGEPGLLMALGPGFSAESVVFRW